MNHKDKFYRNVGNTLCIDNNIDSTINVYNSNLAEKIEYISFPYHLERIGSETFKSYKKIQTLTFPESLSHIGSYAFFECSSLNHVDMSNTNLKNIKLGVFSRCNLESIMFNEDLENIDVEAFSYNPIEKIIFNKNLKSIRTTAFKDCKKLKNIEISMNTKIDYNAFLNCKDLKNIKIYDFDNTDIIYKIDCNDEEYVSNIYTFNDGFIVITTNLENDKQNTIHILYNKKEYKFKTKETSLKDKNMSLAIRDNNNLNTFKIITNGIKNYEYDSCFINDISYFSCDLDKVQRYLDSRELVNYFCRKTRVNTSNKRRQILDILNGLHLFDENRYNTLILLNILVNINNMEYRNNFSKVLEIINNNTSPIRRFEIMKSLNIKYYKKNFKDLEQFIHDSYSNELINKFNSILGKYDGNILKIQEELLWISKYLNNNNNSKVLIKK